MTGRSPGRGRGSSRCVAIENRSSGFGAGVVFFAGTTSEKIIHVRIDREKKPKQTKKRACQPSGCLGGLGESGITRGC